jgi:hypothetical protein
MARWTTVRGDLRAVSRSYSERSHPNIRNDDAGFNSDEDGREAESTAMTRATATYHAGILQLIGMFVLRPRSPRTEEPRRDLLLDDFLLIVPDLDGDLDLDTGTGTDIDIGIRLGIGIDLVLDRSFARRRRFEVERIRRRFRRYR